jgi:class 3 adenylate cyclase
MDDFGVDDTANCFVPEMLVDFVDKSLQQGKEGIEPTSFFINGVCLLVDISGFTKLSGDFCGMGKSGIDELQLATNGYMGKLVEIIYTFGGEIIKFAGDAIICVFSANFITAVEPKKKGGKLRRSVYDFKHLTLQHPDGHDVPRAGEEQKDKEKDSPHTFVTAQSRPESRNGSSNSGGGKGDKSSPKSPARPLVLKITPQPSVRGHAAMWVDAIYAAMQLQCHEPAEEVRCNVAVNCVC